MGFAAALFPLLLFGLKQTFCRVTMAAPTIRTRKFLTNRLMGRKQFVSGGLWLREGGQGEREGGSEDGAPPSGCAGGAAAGACGGGGGAAVDERLARAPAPFHASQVRAP